MSSDMHQAALSNQLMAMWGNKPRLHCLLCLIPSPWLHLFVPNKTRQSSFEKVEVRAERFVSNSASRTSWLSPAKSCVSIQNITLKVRYVLTDYNLGIHKATGQWIGRNYRAAFDTRPAKMSDLWPGRHTKDTMPLFNMLPFSPSKHPHTCVICVSSQLQRRVESVKTWS